MRFALVMFFLSCFLTTPVHADDHPTIPERLPLLKALDGQWRMSGDVMGKAVTYSMQAGPILQGAFTELHMDDVQRPSEYEARVILGYDEESKTLIAHWMDSFGARYSIPHGTGHITDNSIQFTIPYEGGSFRDTLTYNPAAKTWLFVIEAAKPDGTWQHFARYTMSRS
ncbi:DUF1579 family protein [Rheinheimera sp.]|uniref:DUF1579 family protein n=1 Tax=Rheinheimera sp. TaxID=1869214 RepID=UPI0026269925|nr:DUF1579 family protein [Rheinheimera sp.]MCA1928358.1 DUF1579 domain-containing protein [Rheinheimera sp.]